MQLCTCTSHTHTQTKIQRTNSPPPWQRVRLRRVAHWSRLILMVSLTEVRGDGKRKDKTNCRGRQIFCGIAKICPISECKTIKGKPIFQQAAPGRRSAPHCRKNLSLHIYPPPLLFLLPFITPCFPSLSPCCHFPGALFPFYSPFSFFLPFFCTLFFVTYCFPSLDLDLSSLHPVFLSSSSITPLNFPAVRHEAPQHSSFIFFPPTRPSPLLPSFLSLSPLLFSFLFLCPSTVPSFLLPSPFSFLSSVALSFVWLKHQYSGDWPRR